MKSSPLLDSLWGVNFFITINGLMKRFPLLSPLKFFFIPPSVLTSLPQVLKLNRKELTSRISRRSTTTHLDYFDQLCPPDGPEPSKKDLKHMEMVAGQLLSAGYEPISSQFLCTIMFLLHDPASYKRLVEEIRGKFKSYDDINPDAVAHLRFLHASLMETLRITVIGSNGLPRVCPGAMVDGNYIARGV